MTIRTPVFFIAVGGADKLGNGRYRVDVGDAAAGYDAFLNSGTGRVERILHTKLLFLHLGLGSSADLNDCNAAGQLRKALLELLAVKVGGRHFDGVLNLGNAVLNLFRIALAADNNGIFLGNLDLTRTAELCKRGLP